MVRKSLLASVLGLFGFVMSIPCFVSAQQQYDAVLGITTDDKSLTTAINGGDVVEGKVGSELFNEQVLSIIGYVIDIFIVLGIAVAFIGAYEIMTSDKEETMKKGIRLVAFGVIGIIIMVSARFIANGLVGTDGVIAKQREDTTGNPSGIQFADSLYKEIMFPFIKVALYFVVGALFFIMVGKVVSFLTSTDGSAKKKAAGIIIWCVVGILIVMGSKQIVESVMGKQDKVLNTETADRISGGEEGMGEKILEFGSIPIIAQIINWVMGLTMLAIVVLIIIQGYKIFTKPDDPKTREGMKKAIIYILIGVLVIGAAYVISNFLVVNNVPITES